MRSLERGLSLSDFEHMTVGMIIDYVITWHNMHLKEDEKEDSERLATQADFDRF